jgi:hypothetical protein
VERTSSQGDFASALGHLWPIHDGLSVWSPC